MKWGLVLIAAALAAGTEQSGRIELEEALARAEMVRLAYPGLGKELLARALDSASHIGRDAYFEAGIDYATDVKDWEEAARWVRRAKDEGFVTLPATQDLLDRLFVVAPRLACDLLAELLANLPATLTKQGDVLFVSRYLRPLEAADAGLHRQAEERIKASKAVGGKPNATQRQRPALPELEQALQWRWHQVLDLEAQRGGRIVVVHFAEAWCPPCKRERPLLERLRAEFAGPNVGWIELDLASAAAKEFSVEELPTTLIFDRRGHLVERMTGEQPEARWRDALSAIKN